jgi:GDP-D-mannose dehydratase
MKTLVTGSRGVVGAHYCSRYGGFPLADSYGLVDICDSARVRSAIATMLPEAVLHLAAQSAVAAQIRVDPALLQPNEQRRVVGRSSKLRHLIGWEPCILMDTTLTDMLQELQVNE